MGQLLNMKLSEKSRLKVRVTGKKRMKISTEINLDLSEAIEFGKKVLKALPK